LAGPGVRNSPNARVTLRLDKWLWHARFFRSRSIASEVVGEGHVRVNGTRVQKLATAVGVGDVLTFVQGNRIRLVRITVLAERRGPATDASTFYDDLEGLVPDGRTATPLPLE